MLLVIQFVLLLYVTAFDNYVPQNSNCLFFSSSTFFSQVYDMKGMIYLVIESIFHIWHNSGPLLLSLLY
jgi:hypothetical protein